MRAQLRPFSLPLRRPLATAAGTIERREGLLVRVESDDGHVGLGEATPLPGWTEPYEACEGALEDAVPKLTDDGPESALASLSGTPAARHGLSLALADLDARRDGVPLYRHLDGDEPVDSVSVNATVGDGDVEGTVEAATDAAEAGFGCLKVKVGARPVDEDVERLAAVRNAVGPDVTLRADANGAWDRETATAAFDAFADLAVEYVEQPLPALDLEGHAALRGGLVGVAIDESLAEVTPERVVEADAADLLVLKPMVLGGVDEARSAAMTARDAGLRCVVTTTVDAVVGRLGAVHLAASLPDPLPAGLATADWLADDVATDPALVADGRIAVPREPGLGVDVEEWSG